MSAVHRIGVDRRRQDRSRTSRNRSESGSLTFALSRIPALENGKAIRRRDKITAAQRRIGMQVDVRQANTVLTVAGTVGDKSVAIEERMREACIMRSVGGDRRLDVTAEKNLRGTEWTKRGAQLSGSCIARGLDGKEPAVAKPHAIGRRPARSGGRCDR